MHVIINHKTSYTYGRPVSSSPQIIRLRPMPLARTQIICYNLDIAPEPLDMSWYHDAQGNIAAVVVLPDKISSFSITVQMKINLEPYNPFDFIIYPELDTTYDTITRRHLSPYLEVEPPGPLLAAMVAELKLGRDPVIDTLVAVTRRIQGMIAYVVRETPGVLDPEETLRSGSGADRDSAWLLTILLRHLGFAARFVSGYLVQPDTSTAPSERLSNVVKEDGLYYHAWTQVYIPGAGWIGLDPTSGLVTAEQHIPLAAGADPTSAAPVSGLVEGAAIFFLVAMSARLVSNKDSD